MSIFHSPRRFVVPLCFLVWAAIKTIRGAPRLRELAKHHERVLVLGASSGIGQSIARQYAQRGAYVCVVGRRDDKVKETVRQCRMYCSVSEGEKRVIGVSADFANVDDMVRVRELLREAWGGVDTVVVAAGVSALQPVLAVSGLEIQNGGTKFLPAQAEDAGVQRVVDVGLAAIQGNYVGPLVSAVTMIPFLTSTSKYPSVLLISSLAAAIPAPTRGIYASTKSSSLVLYQALAMEHPHIAFTMVLPSTVEGDFRSSAVDGGKVREADPNSKRGGGLRRESVASRCLMAVDWRERDVFMPGVMRYAHLLFWLWPSLVEKFAKKKYRYE